MVEKPGLKFLSGNGQVLMEFGTSLKKTGLCGQWVVKCNSPQK